MSLRRWCYVWLLPLVWVLVTYGAAHHPGDEYAMFAVGSLAGHWIILLVGNMSSIWTLLPFLLAAGAVSMAVTGLLLDLLRAPRRWWVMLWGLTAVAFCVAELSSFPTLARALSKHGSLQAYIFFSMNMGMYVACLLMLLFMPVWRLVHRRSPRGYCQECGYDLTGNVSGRCPECGREAHVDVAAARRHRG